MLKNKFGLCLAVVTGDDEGIQYDGHCQLWHHIACIGMSKQEYLVLSNLSEERFCSKCQHFKPDPANASGVDLVDLLRELASVSRNNFQVLPDLNKELPSYYGHGNTIDAREWIDQIESISQIHGWSDAIKFEIAHSKLIGPAKGREIRELPELRKQFCETFIRDRPGNSVEKWKKAYKRFQLRNESVVDYFHQKMFICRDLKINFVFIGLWSKELASYLLGKSCSDENDLLDSLTTFVDVNQVLACRYKSDHANNDPPVYSRPKIHQRLKLPATSSF